MTQRRGRTFFHFLSIPEHMSFICLDIPVGYSLQHSWDSQWPHHLLACTCKSIPSLLAMKAIVHFSSSTILINKPPVAQLKLIQTLNLVDVNF